jgi:hypothetical protein
MNAAHGGGHGLGLPWLDDDDHPFIVLTETKFRGSYQELFRVTGPLLSLILRV